MDVEESAMTDEVLNTLVVLGRRLLLVDVGGGFETHLCEATSDLTARSALDARQPLPDSWADALERGGDDDGLDALLDRLLETAWKPTTLCGRAWDEMAAGEAGVFRRWQEIELTPTCRTCRRVVDTWFPRSGPAPGIGVLVSVIGEKVEAFGSAWVTGVPGEFFDDLRKAIRKHLRGKGFRSQTMVVNGLLHVMSDDALEAIDPDVRAAWIDDAVRRMGVVEPADEGEIAERPRLGVDWRTWVLDA
jgi:hypothetical protein